MASLSLSAFTIDASAALAYRYDFITIYNAYEVPLQQNSNFGGFIELSSNSHDYLWSLALIDLIFMIFYWIFNLLG